MRYRVSDASTPEGLLEDLIEELTFLRDADPQEVDTTLLVHPGVLQDFLDFNDFLDVVDAAVEDLELDGVLQVASAHRTTSSRMPTRTTSKTTATVHRTTTLHLIREESLDRAIEAFPEARTFTRPTRPRCASWGWRLEEAVAGVRVR